MVAEGAGVTAEALAQATAGRVLAQPALTAAGLPSRGRHAACRAVGARGHSGGGAVGELTDGAGEALHGCGKGRVLPQRARRAGGRAGAGAEAAGWTGVAGGVARAGVEAACAALDAGSGAVVGAVGAGHTEGGRGRLCQGVLAQRAGGAGGGARRGRVGAGGAALTGGQTRRVGVQAQPARGAGQVADDCELTREALLVGHVHRGGRDGEGASLLR